MKIYIKNNGKVFLVLQYEGKEYEVIRKQLESIGLKKHKSTQLFGLLPGEFYRATEGEFECLLKKTLNIGLRDVGYDMSFIDDVNRPLYQVDGNYSTFNISIFRIVPVENRVCAPLNMFLTVYDLNKISSCIRKIFETIVNIVNENTIVEIPTKLSGGMVEIK